MTTAVEGWGPFAARHPRPVEVALPAVGTTQERGRRYLAEVMPWRRANAVVSGLLSLVGAVGVGICWNGASREAAFRDQVGWTVGAFLFFAVYVLGAVVWLLAGFRQVRHGAHELQADLAMVFRLDELEVGAALELPASRDVERGLDLVVGPGMARAHRPDCLLAWGKQVRALSPAERSSYPPCGMCM